MKSQTTYPLSRQGLLFLQDPLMKEALSVISNSVGVTSEEYLCRFEEVLRENPKAFFDIFEKQ